MIVAAADLDSASLSHALADLEARCFGSDAWTPAMIRQELTAPARTYVVDVGDADRANDGTGSPDRPAGVRGYAGFWFDGDDAELMTIAVAPEHRRRGLAAAMLRRLTDRARALGARRMLLEVRVDNDPALGLYRGFGFTRIGLRRRYYQPEGVDAYVMALDLAPRTVGFRLPHGSDAQESLQSLQSSHSPQSPQGDAWPSHAGGRSGRGNDGGDDGSGIEG